MLDVILVGFLAFLFARGWYRGFVREGMDLAGLLLGTVLAFRAGPWLGSVVRAMSGVSDGAARLAGGLAIFLAVGAGTALATRAVESRVRLPGLNGVDRAGGAGLATAWGVFLATLVLTLGVVLPVPPTIADALERSAVARTLTDPGGAPQAVFNRLAGDRIVEALMNLQQVVGDRRVVIEGAELIELPPADPSRVESRPTAAAEVFDLGFCAGHDEAAGPLAEERVFFTAAVLDDHGEQVHPAAEARRDREFGDRRSDTAVGDIVGGPDRPGTHCLPDQLDRRPDLGYFELRQARSEFTPELLQLRTRG